MLHKIHLCTIYLLIPIDQPPLFNSIHQLSFLFLDLHDTIGIFHHLQQLTNPSDQSATMTSHTSQVFNPIIPSFTI